MRNWRQSLERRLFQESRVMAPPWGPLLRFLRYPTAIVRDLLDGEINIRAMSLAYITLLSLVPLLVFSFAILKGIGARGDLRYLLAQFFRPMGGAAAQLTDSVMQFVTNMRGDVLGLIGLASLIYTVISTIQKVETSFNFVWRVVRPRSFARRFTEYLSIMIVGPLLLAAAVGLLGTAEHSPFAQWLSAVPLIAATMASLGRFVPYVTVTLVFTLMYVFLPNTRVEFRAAWIGGVTAGVMWALVGGVFARVILYSSQLLAVYSGFAFVLTALIWIYLSWLILLIGAQLAFYVQCPSYLRYGHRSVELAGGARERAALSVLYLIGRDSAAGGAQWTAETLAARFEIPSGALTPVVACLERAELLVVGPRDQLQPAREPANILLADVVAAIRMPRDLRPMIDLDGMPAAAAKLHEVDAAIRAGLGRQSLRDWIAAA